MGIEENTRLQLALSEFYSWCQAPFVFHDNILHVQPKAIVYVKKFSPKEA